MFTASCFNLKKHNICSVVILIVLLCDVGTVTAQLADDIFTRKDKRTYRERADELFQTGLSDGAAIRLYEQWLNVVPADSVAANKLLQLYTRNGRKQDEVRLGSYLKSITNTPDQRIQTVQTLQVRLGLYKVLLPRQLKPGVTYPSVLVLHGNGNTEDLMIEWIKSFNMDSVIFVFPQAPYPKMADIKATQRDAYSATDAAPFMSDSLRNEVVSTSAIWYRDAYLDASIRYPISAVKPIIVGFSQGGFYAYAVATRFPETFQGIVSVSASMYAYGEVQQYIPVLKTHGIEVLVLHGTKDAVVRPQTGELLSALLTRNGVTNTFRFFDGGHWPTPDASAMVREWLASRLK
ncbi:MAG: hypothetical protein OKBPIBMD_01785 [Chlorobi bacterium]|nr:hypothetical protein [Chlorobiota bacterium]